MSTEKRKQMAAMYQKLGLSVEESAIAAGIEVEILKGAEPLTALQEGFVALGLTLEQARIAAPGNKNLQESRAEGKVYLRSRVSGDDFFINEKGEVLDDEEGFRLYNQQNGNQLKTFVTASGKVLKA